MSIREVQFKDIGDTRYYLINGKVYTSDGTKTSVGTAGLTPTTEVKVTDFSTPQDKLTLRSEWYPTIDFGSEPITVTQSGSNQPDYSGRASSLYDDLISTRDVAAKLEGADAYDAAWKEHENAADYYKQGQEGMGLSGVQMLGYATGNQALIDNPDQKGSLGIVETPIVDNFTHATGVQRAVPVDNGISSGPGWQYDKVAKHMAQGGTVPNNDAWLKALEAVGAGGTGGSGSPGLDQIMKALVQQKKAPTVAAPDQDTGGPLVKMMKNFNIPLNVPVKTFARGGLVKIQQDPVIHKYLGGGVKGYDEGVSVDDGTAFSLYSGYEDSEPLNETLYFDDWNSGSDMNSGDNIDDTLYFDDWNSGSDLTKGDTLSDTQTWEGFLNGVKSMGTEAAKAAKLMNADGSWNMANLLAAGASAMMGKFAYDAQSKANDEANKLYQTAVKPTQQALTGALGNVAKMQNTNADLLAAYNKPSVHAAPTQRVVTPLHMKGVA